MAKDYHIFARIREELDFTANQKKRRQASDFGDVYWVGSETGRVGWVSGMKQGYCLQTIAIYS